MTMGDSRLSKDTMIAYIPWYKAMTLSASCSIIYIGYTPSVNSPPSSMKSTDWRIVSGIKFTNQN